MEQQLQNNSHDNSKWTVIATWKFGIYAAQAGSVILRDGKSSMDCVEKSIQVIDLDTSVDDVGIGGLPNEEGEVELDGAIMDGATLRLGAVAGIKRHPHPASIGRKIMENLSHTFLIGEDADKFADEQGFESMDLLTEESKAKWEQWKQSGKPEQYSHDTVGVVARDVNGHICAGTSTSGLKYKKCGRVGDSPLVGSGFYADDEGGGAAATGHGEYIMRGCLSFYTVELMKGGMHPQEAVNAAITRFAKRVGLEANEGSGEVALIAVDKEGRWGGAANHNKFSYAICNNGMDKTSLVDCKAL